MIRNMFEPRTQISICILTQSDFFVYQKFIVQLTVLWLQNCERKYHRHIGQQNCFQNIDKIFILHNVITSLFVQFECAFSVHLPVPSKTYVVMTRVSTFHQSQLFREPVNIIDNV